MTMRSMTPPTTEQWEACRDLPEASRLFASWVRYEIDMAKRAGPDPAEDTYVQGLARTRDAVFAATRIWYEEMANLRERVATRIAAEVPIADQETRVVEAVRENDWTFMQP